MKGFAAGIVAGALLSLAVGHAKAQPGEPGDAVVAYTSVFGGILCDAMDADPVFATVDAIGSMIVQDGLSWRQAGQVVVLTVTEICPRHLSLITAYAQQHEVAA